jgi:phospholipid transport system substrate-binding protein
LRRRAASRGIRTALGLLWLIGTSALAAPPPESPSAAVRRTLDKASVLADTDLTHEQRLEALRAVARELVDTRAMGRQAIGPLLWDRSQDEQEAFLQLFDELILRAYLQKLFLFHNPKFRFAAEEQNDSSAIVRTELLTKKDVYHVTYEMHREGGRWLATNIIVEGVSLTSNYANQFASVLRDRSFEELLELMRRKVSGFRNEYGA